MFNVTLLKTGKDKGQKLQVFPMSLDYVFC